MEFLIIFKDFKWFYEKFFFSHNSAAFCQPQLINTIQYNWLWLAPNTMISGLKCHNKFVIFCHFFLLYTKAWQGKKLQVSCISTSPWNWNFCLFYTLKYINFFRHTAQKHQNTIKMSKEKGKSGKFILKIREIIELRNANYRL